MPDTDEFIEDYVYDSADFYESWNADEIDTDFLPGLDELDESDMWDI